jgi:hypothetical protein
MKTLRTLSIVALGAAALSLAACKNEPETMNVGTGDPDAANLANAGDAPPIPMIKGGGTYRCKDNSLAIVDFMTDDKTANYKSAKDAPVTVLTAAEAGKPFVSPDGKTTLEGSGDTITVNGLSCKKG